MAESLRKICWAKRTFTKIYLLYVSIYKKFKNQQNIVRMITFGGLSTGRDMRSLLGCWLFFSLDLTCMIYWPVWLRFVPFTIWKLYLKKENATVLLNSKMIYSIHGIVRHINNNVPKGHARTVLYSACTKGKSFIHPTFTVCLFHDKKLM